MIGSPYKIIRHIDRGRFIVQEISGYNIDIIEQSIFSRLSSCTADAINRKLEAVDQTISAETNEVFISLGENCGAAFQMRNSGINTLGANFFDNTVIRAEDIPNIISDRFRSMLSLINLSIGSWEGHDSVYDDFYKIFFHHYFIPGHGVEKYNEKMNCRQIDKEDIPLFLPVVRGQFEYLAGKFIKIANAQIKKYYVIRNVEGRAISEATLDRISAALTSIGAVNYDLIQVITYLDGPPISKKYGHWSILEEGERWGDKAEWLAYSQGRERGNSWR